MLLQRRVFFVREHVAFVKLTDTYDILDPETKAPIGLAREEPAPWAKWLRLLVSKALLPTAVRIYEGAPPAGSDVPTSPPVLELKRGVHLLRPKVQVLNAGGGLIGTFESKLFSLGGGFWVNDPQGQRVAEVKGDWKGWNFKLLDPTGRELGTVTKKWAGIGKELFTTADNYVIALSELAAGTPELPALMLAAGLAIDMVFKEREG